MLSLLLLLMSADLSLVAAAAPSEAAASLLKLAAHSETAVRNLKLLFLLMLPQLAHLVADVFAVSVVADAVVVVVFGNVVGDGDVDVAVQVDGKQ